MLLIFEKYLIFNKLAVYVLCIFIFYFYIMPENNENWFEKHRDLFLEFATSTNLNRIWRAKFISTSIVFWFVMWILWWLASSLFWILDSYLWYPVFSLLSSLIFTVLTIYWSVYIYNKRFHDFWKSWWWQLLLFVPIANLVVLLILCLKSWDKEDNIYWAASETKQREKIVAWLFPILIAFLIVWLFAAALLPRMKSIQSESHDATRRADINQLNNAIIRYYDFKWEFPLAEESVNWIPASQISSFITDLWLPAVPFDPDPNNFNSWLWTATTNWEYLYMVSTKNTITHWWFILLAKTNTLNWSNWVVCGNWEWVIEPNYDISNLNECNSLINSSKCSNDGKWNCTYNSNDQLRYIDRY